MNNPSLSCKVIDDLVEYEEVIDTSNTEYIALRAVTFKKDFGIWKQGDKEDYLDFRLDEGIACVTNDEGEATGKQQALGLVDLV